MKLIMENWRIFLEQEQSGYVSSNASGAIIDLPGGDSEEDKERRKMTKYKPPEGLGSNVHYSAAPENTMSAEYLLKYLKKLSREEPHPEILRNSVRYLVKKYCKNPAILGLFNKLESLSTIQATKRLTYLANKKHIEKWHSRAHHFDNNTAGEYTGRGDPEEAEIDIYNTGAWQEWWGWDRLVEETFPFVKPIPTSTNSDPLRTRTEKRYTHSVARNYNRFLTLLKALSVSTVYVHELAHAVDLEITTRRESPEIYATNQTLKYIRNLEKNILNDIFSETSTLPGNFNSWGTKDEFVNFSSDSIPILSALSKVSPKAAISKSIKTFIGYHKASELEYQRRELSKTNPYIR